MGSTIHYASRVILPFSFFLSLTAARAQESPFFEFGLNLGRMVYQGDLTPSPLGSFRTSRTSFGITAAKVLPYAFSVRASFVHGGIAGNDGIYKTPEYRQQRNFRFSSPVNELTAHLVWSYPGVPRYERGFTPYVFVGGGLSLFNVRPDASSFNAEFFGSEAVDIQAGLDADAQHGAPGLMPIVMAGGGFKYFFHQSWGVNLEASYRTAFSDYLDGFSQSVNPELNDHYMNYSVGILYRRGKKGSSVDCPKVRY